MESLFFCSLLSARVGPRLVVSKAAQLAYLGVNAALWCSILSWLAFWQAGKRAIPLWLTQSLAQVALGLPGVGGEEKGVLTWWQWPV